MNLLFYLGILLLVGYTAGWLVSRIGIPKIIGYMIVGVIFSPHMISFLPEDLSETTHPVLEICLSFIAFEIGGALRWQKLKDHQKEIVSITLLASMLPFVLITGGVLALGWLFPEMLPFNWFTLLLLALLLGALASPTDPTATFAVMHEYGAKGKVTDTIVGVAALDDAVGILIFSLTTGLAAVYAGGVEDQAGTQIGYAFYQVAVSIGIGLLIGSAFTLLARFFRIRREGRWVVIVFALITFCAGLAELLGVDAVLAAMTTGFVVANTCRDQKRIFGILERYTEELVFLFFFLLSGLYLDTSTLLPSLGLILLFVILRMAGKYLGGWFGARLVDADPPIRKHVAGGLISQGGIVIGLVLNVYDTAAFHEMAELLLTTIMGATIIHELVGPLAAKYSLKRAGEID